jgi:hypothetical protein
MGPYATTAAGILTGLVLFLTMALLGVIAVNGTNNPGIGPARPMTAAAGATAEAAPLPKPKPESWTNLDLDGDGKLSLAEAAGHADIVTRFQRADRNKDGKLTQAEYDRLAKLPPPKARKPVPRETLRRDAAATAKGG